MPTDLSAALVSRANLRDQLLGLYPELADDETALMDTLAGLDNFEEQVLAVLRHAIEREAHGKALGEMIDTMTGRKRRLEDGAKTMRAAVLHAMQEAGLKKLSAADVTVSIGAGKPRLIITDEAAVPDEFCRITRAPDKSAIAKAFGAGDLPSWATLSNPQPFLTVHRK